MQNQKPDEGFMFVRRGDVIEQRPIASVNHTAPYPFCLMPETRRGEVLQYFLGSSIPVLLQVEFEPLHQASDESSELRQAL